jgi:hypothetical protein
VTALWNTRVTVTEENLSITSMEVDFWGVKSSGCEKLKKRNERQNRRKFKIFQLPFLISQQKRIFDQNSFTIQMSLGVFQNKISHENESHKILIFVALTFISLIFRKEILYAKYVDLLDKLEEFKKSPLFSTVF